MLTFLVAMDLPITHWPAYASMFVFELWQSSNQEYFVRAIYDGEVQKLPNYSSDVKAPTGLCHWKDFQALTNSFQPPSQAIE
jgi:hypothetical protein